MQKIYVILSAFGINNFNQTLYFFKLKPQYIKVVSKLFEKHGFNSKIR